MRTALRQVFRFRDESVHPSAAFSEPILHPVLDVGVERRFVVFRSENAHAATNVSLGLIWRLAQKPRSKYPMLVEWCEAMLKTFIPPRLDRWKTTPGLGVPPKPRDPT
jgi:hypothetical protein